FCKSRIVVLTEYLASDDCWLMEIKNSSDEILDGSWKEVELAYDHGEPRCNHATVCMFPGQVVIVSGLTQPFYLTMYLLVEHAEEMLRIRFSPPSLFELTIEYLSATKKVPKESWFYLPQHLRQILEVRTDPFEIHGI
ncbi:hypothetical protein Avbf_05477, partial [Armadillidium vulgare]